VSKPSIILLPGLDGTGDLFDPLLAVIPRSIRSRIISYPIDQALSYDGLLSFIEDQLHDEQEMVLLGESFSGPLALRFAEKYPSRIKAIVLCASFISSPAPQWLRHFVHPLLFRLPLLTFVVRRFLLGLNASDFWVRKVKRTIRRIRPEVFAHRLKEVLSLECSDFLKTCPGPILYLAASHDALVSLTCAKQIQAIRPDVSVRILNGPHLLLQIQPVASWREIERFLYESSQEAYSFR
jgi:pimeloyl-[acyl-carrier protein] methyl ester esterase